MNAAPAISVIIPAFNSAAFVADTLRSVQAQTFRDFEVVVVDDGSTDATAEIVREFCRDDSRFQLIQQPNAGLPGARNTGIRHARGEWVAFVDSDDLWLPEKLEKQLAAGRRDPKTNFTFTNFLIWDGTRDLGVGYPENEPLPEGDVVAQLIFRFLFLPSTVMLRRQTAGDGGLFDATMKIGEDWDFWLRLAARDMVVAGVREPLVRYRQWPGSLTAKGKLKSLDANVRVLKKNLPAIIAKYPSLRPQCEQSVAAATTVLEITSACVSAEESALLAAVWSAWERERRAKWLRWYLLLRWPRWLGGGPARKSVREKIRRRWPLPSESP
ncbi:MAG TPA: glycosyltransferase [Verrucomicrobiae bacterium]|nr:glycosyltransferase [Verrucomicrobiae bacterium]